MKQKIMTIFARTPVCVGAGSSVGAIDLPIMRERHTRIPIIPGSSIKGVLRDLWNTKDDNGKIAADDVQDNIFGKSEAAGKLIVGEGRTLAFPVRSARGMFAWVTSPLALERFARDTADKIDIPFLEDMECIASSELCNDNKAVFEEYCFERKAGLPADLLETFKKLSDDEVWKSVSHRLAVISDEMFSYFVENTCEIPARICIDDKTGIVENLFNQEQVPSETMFYNVLSSDYDDILAKVTSKLNATPVMQFGGDETIGLGYCSIKVM